VKYQAISLERSCYPVKLMCRALKVEPVCFYRWLKGIEQRHIKNKEREAVADQVEQLFFKSKETYGRRRIYHALRRLGLIVNMKTIGQILKRKGLRAKAGRKYKATTQSSHKHPVAENILNRNFKASAPNQKWASDITYVWTLEGWLYVVVFIDLFNRKVVGWSMGERITSELVCDAFDMAYQRRTPSNILICHSDRGSQYAASEFQKMLKKANFICSMSRKGNCWDNAVVESFFGSLKTEVVHGNLFRTRNEARRTIFEWIEVTYNKDRTHSSLGYLSPEEYEAEFYSSTALKIESASATNQNAT
jgi:putative transposase